jgi:quercetin dioxygenase-like cupin family protein
MNDTEKSDTISGYQTAEEQMNRTLSVIMAGTFIVASASAGLWAQTQAQVIQSPTAAKWGPAPPMLPPGAEIAVLSGDPGKSAAYAIRLKFPANYAIPAHSHPTDENVVVTTGALTFGMGDKLAKTEAANKTLSVGGYALMPANMNHFAYAGAGGATVVLYGQGPVEFKK